MKIPGITTTRLHVALAVMCAASHTLAGVAVAGLVLAVLGGRLLLVRHQHADRLPARAATVEVPSSPAATAA